MSKGFKGRTYMYCTGAGEREIGVYQSESGYWCVGWMDNALKRIVTAPLKGLSSSASDEYTQGKLDAFAKKHHLKEVGAVETPEVLSKEVALEKRSVGRPANLLKIAPARAMPERISTIAEYHNAAMACMAQGAMYALLCGFELHAAKAVAPQGEWLKWVADNCPFSASTATAYMMAAERKYGSIPALALVKGFALGKAPHLLDQDQLKKLVKAVSGATDGESIRQLYLDLGIIKGDPQLGGHHPPAETKTEEERKALLEANRKKMALADLQSWKTTLTKWVAERQYRHCSDMELEAAHDALDAAITLIPKLNGRKG